MKLQDREQNITIPVRTITYFITDVTKGTHYITVSGDLLPKKIAHTYIDAETKLEDMLLLQYIKTDEGSFINTDHIVSIQEIDTNVYDVTFVLTRTYEIQEDGTEDCIHVTCDKL